MRTSILPLLLCYLFSCQGQVPIDNITEKPLFSDEDSLYANVYKLLDGTWKGRFLIYQDQKPQSKNEAALYELPAETFNWKAFELIDSIEVTQVYSSETPYFQKVTITDRYYNSQEVVSKGVNKVQDGQLWCVVRKPDETVIHKGSTEGTNTIIWQRAEQNPQRVEYFKETVSDHSYEIIGWGYYEGDNLSLSPRLWFYAQYQRQQ